MKTAAAILVEQHKPLLIDEVELPALGCDQVLVQVKVSRICGSQLGEIEGVKGPDKYLPYLLGHEGGGIVVEVGPEVSHVKPGDHVVLHWRPGAGIQAAPSKYRLVLVGVMRHDQQLSLNTLPLHCGKILTGSEGGSSQPHLDIPCYLRMIRASRFDRRGMISHRCSLTNVNPAIATMHAGESIHTMIHL